MKLVLLPSEYLILIHFTCQLVLKFSPRGPLARVTTKMSQFWRERWLNWHIFDLLVFHLTPSLLYSHRIVRTFAKGRQQTWVWGMAEYATTDGDCINWKCCVLSSISRVSTPIDTVPDDVKAWVLRWSGRCCAGLGLNQVLVGVMPI